MKNNNLKMISLLGKIIGELMGLLIVVVMLMLLLPKWELVTGTYETWMRIGVWTAALSSMLKIFKHISDYKVLDKLFEIGSLAASFYSIQKMRQLRPFDFAKINMGGINEAYYFMMGLVMWAVAVGMVATFIQIFTPDRKKK